MLQTRTGNGESQEAVSDIGIEPVELDALRPLRGDELAIVGFSETTRGMAPFDNEEVEIWICNRLGLQKGIDRWDRHMDLHPLEWSAINHHEENWRTYKEWLEQDHGEKLIYFPRPDPEVAKVPNLVSFPREEVLATVRGREYFSSAIGWQLGLALALHERHGKPKKIGLYGIDLRGLSEYEYQRPNAEWLLGIAEGRGIELEIPDTSALLNQDHRAPLYGIDLYNGFAGDIEKALEARGKDIEKKMKELTAENQRILNELNTWDGARQENQSWYQRVQQWRRGGQL